MDFDALDRSLRESAQDFTLDADEKIELRELGRQLDAGRIRFLRQGATVTDAADMERSAREQLPAALEGLRQQALLAS